MPLQKLQFRPGVNREGTNYSNEGGWYECDKVRFRSGFPEKIGGWTRATPGYTYVGVCRMMINWVDLAQNNLLGVGTNLKYYINRGLGIYYDITPIRLERTGGSALTNPFTTTVGSATVRVTDSANGAIVGDYVTFSGATTVNGIPDDELNTEHKITNVLDVNTYEIEVTSVATSSGSGGGTVDAVYQINIGGAIYTIGNGFGAGIWNGAVTTVNADLVYTSGTGNIWLNSSSTTINVDDTTGFSASGTLLIDSEIITYSGKTSTTFTGCVRGTSETPAVSHGVDPTAVTPPAIKVYQVTSLAGTTGWGEGSDTAFGIGQQLRLWTNDNYGEDLLINPRGGPIYYWYDNTSTYPPAVTLESLASGSIAPGTAYTYQDFVPKNTNQITVSDVNRFVIAMGSNNYDPTDPNTDFDPLLVRWSDQENPFDWVPTATNQSGEQRLTNGSFIMSSKKTRQEILIWTDAAIYSMQYLGPPYTFGFQLLMDNISMMSPNAATVINNVAYWMGTDKFYSYSGRVETLPCSLRQYIFNDISFEQRFQTVCGSNEGYNEVWWYYVSNTEVALAAQESRDPTIDRYVVYNHLERVWYYGSMRRTFWLDSPLQSYPLAAYGNDTDTATNTLLFHENGTDDASTASPAPFTAYIQSSDFDIGDGHNFGFVWRIIPDITFTGSNSGYPKVTMEVRPRQFSGSPYGPTDVDTVQTTQQYTPVVKSYTVEQYTPQVYTRIRGRQIAFRIESADQLGVAWQLGSPRIDIRPDGRR